MLCPCVTKLPYPLRISLTFYGFCMPGNLNWSQYPNERLPRAEITPSRGWRGQPRWFNASTLFVDHVISRTRLLIYNTRMLGCVSPQHHAILYLTRSYLNHDVALLFRVTRSFSGFQFVQQWITFTCMTFEHTCFIIPEEVLKFSVLLWFLCRRMGLIIYIPGWSTEIVIFESWTEYLLPREEGFRNNFDF